MVPGDLFVVWSGERADGRVHVPQAIERGAVAVIAQGPPLAAPGTSAPPWLQVARPRALLGPLAARLYGHPDRELALVGVTGTNGKSTTVERAAAHARGRRQAVRFARHARLPTSPAARYGGERTTPEASDLFRLLREMRDAGAAAVAMEVSSHALVQGRRRGRELRRRRASPT